MMPTQGRTQVLLRHSLKDNYFALRSQCSFPPVPISGTKNPNKKLRTSTDHLQRAPKNPALEAMPGVPGLLQAEPLTLQALNPAWGREGFVLQAWSQSQKPPTSRSLYLFKFSCSRMSVTQETGLWRAKEGKKKKC